MDSPGTPLISRRDALIAGAAATGAVDETAAAAAAPAMSASRREIKGVPGLSMSAPVGRSSGGVVPVPSVQVSAVQKGAASLAEAHKSAIFLEARGDR